MSVAGGGEGACAPCAWPVGEGVRAGKIEVRARFVYGGTRHDVRVRERRSLRVRWKEACVQAWEYVSQ